MASSGLIHGRLYNVFGFDLKLPWDRELALMLAITCLVPLSRHWKDNWKQLWLVDGLGLLSQVRL